MKKNSEMVAVNFDMPASVYKKLKAFLKKNEITMSDFVLEAALENVEVNTCPYPNCGIPNEETIKAIRDVEAGRDLVEIKDIEEFYRQFRIK